MKRALFGVMTIMLFVLSGTGILIHLWSSWLIFTMYGLIWAAVALCAPVLSQLYLLYEFYQRSHTIINPYSLVIGIYFLIVFLVKTIWTNTAG